jgi:hypothetical protein
MPYVKISDPAIIDLASFQQIVQVVNQHSDSISAFTNDYGITWTPNYTNDDWASAFDLSTQSIQFGRAKLNTTDSNSSGIWYESIAFTIPFSATPIVTATVNTGITGSPVSTPNSELIVEVYNVIDTGFTYKVKVPGSTAGPSSAIFVNWIAIGPK